MGKRILSVIMCKIIALGFSICIPITHFLLRSKEKSLASIAARDSSLDIQDRQADVCFGTFKSTGSYESFYSGAIYLPFVLLDPSAS